MTSEAKIKNMECGRLLHYKHSVGESNFHLQFTPNFRRSVFLSEEVRLLCKETFMQKAAELGITIFCIEFGPDHCHMFVGNCKNYAVPQLVQSFKGYASKVIRKTLWHIVSQHLWGKRFWSEGYFFESVGRVTSQTVKFYIERQQGKHWTNEELLRFEKSLTPDYSIPQTFRTQGKPVTSPALERLKVAEDKYQKNLANFF